MKNEYDVVKKDNNVININPVRNKTLKEMVVKDISKVLSFPIKNFMDFIPDLSNQELEKLKDLESKTLNRSRYINIIDAQLTGSHCVIEEDPEDNELIVRDGKAFIMKDGEEVPYTSNSLNKLDQFIEEEIDNEDRKKRAMELL